MPNPGGPENEPRNDEPYVNLSLSIPRRRLLQIAGYGGVAVAGAVVLGGIQRIFSSGETRLATSTPQPPQPLSQAERAVLPQELIEEIERERGIPTPTPTETLKNWKKYEYGPRSIIADIQMFASAMIPEGWHGAEVPQGGDIWPAFQLTEEWFPPNGDWTEYVKSGKEWMQIGLTRDRVFSVSREDYNLRRPPIRNKGKMSTILLGGMFGSIQDIYLDDEKPTLWIQTFAAFLERTDRILFIRYGSGADRQRETEPTLRKIAQSLQFSIMPDYAVGRGRKVASITAKTVSGTENWKTYHYFTRHKDPWTPIKKPLMEVAVLLPPQWQFVGCEENTGSYPCFLFWEDKSGKGLRQNMDKADTYGAGFVEETAGGVPLEKYPRKQIDSSFIQSGRYRVTKEGKVGDMVIGKYRGKAQDFELELGDKPREGDMPSWVRVFGAPLADGTDRRFGVFFGGRPIARRAELESDWDKVIQSMDLRFYHKLE